MKTILFLQGSPFYDLVEAEKRLQGIDRLFYEKAIVYGRVSFSSVRAAPRYHAG
jgi:hypothetical protein